MRVVIVIPAPPGARTGNQTTAERWAAILGELGHPAEIASRWSGEPCDALVALHGLKSRESIHRYHQAHPERPLVVALTGTDIYGDPEDRSRLWESLSLATRIVVLQPLAANELPEPFRGRTRVIHQSVTPVGRPGERAARASFDVCVLSHLRAVKDPFRAARAARLLPPASRVRILLLGGALEAELEAAARAEEAQNPRFRWLGNQPFERAFHLLAASDLMVNSSLREGGANAVGEAIVASVPVLASRIPGNVGLLGEEYPGYFEAEDTDALAALLSRAETDPSFLASLERHGQARRDRFEPRREREAWRSLLREVAGEAG